MLFWDASALIKRDFHETGSVTVNALFNVVPAFEMGSTPWGYAETYSILLRRFNTGALDQPTFQGAVTALQKEAVGSGDFLLLTISDTLVFVSHAVMQRHNLNATDAAALTTLKEFSLAPEVPACVLLAVDKRLIRPATAEGFAAINPETISDADALTFLSTL